MATITTEWKCAGCGIVCPDRVRRCDCITNALYIYDGKKMTHETKVANLKNRTELSKLRQAIIDNTKGDMFWIGEILLSELEKETGFKG